jgi:biopolymer transport protein ExbB/TolQ
MLVHRLLRVALLGSEWVMWLLLGLSVLSFAAMFERFIFFARRKGDTDALGDRLASLVESGDEDGAEKLLADSRTIEAQVLLAALHWIRGGAESFSDAVDSQLGKRKKDLERGMSLLGTLGSNAPFIGLFGTVIGVIDAFHQLGAGAGSKSSMDNVMGLIGEALVATGVGLFVAIPAVIAYNLVQKRIGEVEGNIASMTKQICAILKAQTHTPPPPAVVMQRRYPANGSMIAGEAE